MLLKAIIAATLFFVSTLNAEKAGCPTPSSSSSSSSFAFSSDSIESDGYWSSSSSRHATPGRCLRALEEVLAAPNAVAYQYFAPFEATIRRQKDFWFNPATQTAYAESFTQQTGVSVRIRDASGTIIYPIPDPSTRKAQTVSIERSSALNEGVAVRLADNTHYGFNIFDNFGQILSINLYQANTNLPLRQYCIRSNRK